jgi:hypothetical protein
MIALEHGREPTTAAMSPEQLDQIAETVRNNLLNHLDREVDRTMGSCASQTRSATTSGSRWWT